MKTESKEILMNVLILGGVFIIFLVFIASITYYFSYENKECLQNPLSYGAKQIEEQYGYEFTARGFLHTPLGVQSPNILITSENVTATP